MEAIKAIIEEANNSIKGAVDGLDKTLRPAQRASFQCYHACTDDARAAGDVSACIAQCQEPMGRLQEALSDAQDGFQNGIRACHESAGAKLDPKGPASLGKPTAAEMEAYAAAFRPCVAKEIAGINVLVQPVYKSAGEALVMIKARTPRTASGGWLW
jgi:hypothetical protein